MKTFNVHFNFGPGKLEQWLRRRGFTAVVEQSVDPLFVDVCVSFCSKKDEFNKKKGVISALEHSPIRVHKKALPQTLMDFEQECFTDNLFPTLNCAKYMFVYRHFF